MSGVRRIVVFGPESTGKSTLAEAVAAHLGEPWAPEYVREYWDAHDGVITTADLDAIGRGQVAGEDAAEARARRAYVCDTDLLTCTLWNDLLFAGACPEWERAEADARARRTALYLFCDIDMPWTSDPQRCFPDDAGRRMCRRVWTEALESRGIACALVRGVGQARVQAALEAVGRLLAT